MLKDNLFRIGVLLFSITLFIEHLVSVESNATCFLKGLGAGLQLVGIVVLIMNKHKKSRQTIQ